MNLNYQGQEHIPASKATVWAFINDPDKIAHCMPDLLESTVHDPQHFDAVVQVGLGPVRGKFKFKIALDPQADGSRMDMKISGGGLGSVVDLTATALVTEGTDGTTTLDWTGAASMRGPIAAVGGRVVDAQAQRVIGETFANVKAKLTAAAGAA
jgi:carbon monoxide dehydrogenase subunit G